MQILMALALAMSMTATPPDQCLRDPLELPLFDATPAAVIAAASPEIHSSELLEPRPVIVEMVACMNDVDPASQWAIFSPRWLASHFTDSTVHYQPAFESLLANPPLGVREPIELVDVSEAELLPDGRMAVEITLSSDGASWTDRLILVLIDDTWYIDDVEPISPLSSTPAS